MATFYLEVTSGGDVLAVDANTALAYQTGSVDGTLVTITPTLEAVGFDLPSDIGIFYKDSTSGTWLPSNAAGRTFEVLLADGSYTYEAQLRYDADTPVTDENGAEVAIQTTAFTVGAASGTAPTFDATPAASATNPTVGDSVSVTGYAASGDPAPTVSFEWFVGGVSQAETTDTFDTTSLSGGETLTCTVTASNGVSPDAVESVDFGTVAAAPSSTDIFQFTWDGTTGNSKPYTEIESVNSSSFDVISATSIRLRFASTADRHAFEIANGNVASGYELRNDTDSTIVSITSAGPQFSTSYKWDLGSSLISGKTYTLVVV